MEMICKGQHVECIELYPCTTPIGDVEVMAFSIVGRGGRTLVSDRVFRRPHQTVLGLLQETITMVRHSLHGAA